MLNKILFVFCFLILIAGSSFGQLKVSSDQRFLQTTDGKPFFWLGDTAWELFHRLNREEAELYLKDRAQKGFTVIQAVILAELDGLNYPNSYGEKPLLNNDPLKPNEAYFKHIDHIIKKAEDLGLVMALLPSWGDKWNKASWGTGPEIFSALNARAFGKFIGMRYRNNSVVWVLGGDRPIMDQEDRAIITAMAEGLAEGDDGKHLNTFHPPGGKSSYDFFPDAPWIDFHMSQSGHSHESKNYTYNIKSRSIIPLRPHLDGEPRYEDHPSQWLPIKFGWMDDFDARQTAYWSMLSGAFGHTYGNHNIWQFYTEERAPVSWARTHWVAALNHPGSFHAGLMRKLFEKRDWQSLVPDQSILPENNPENAQYQVAAISSVGDFLMAYLPYGIETVIKTDKLKAQQLKGWLFNPRDGRSISLGTFQNTGFRNIKPHSQGRGSDWVVIIDDASKNFADPQVASEQRK